MPTALPTRRSRQSERKLDLPPPFRLVRLREVGDAFAHAVAIAAEAGAGTLVHVGRFETAEFAVVLEPELPLQLARRVLYLGLCALGDALAARVPPQRTIGFAWPDLIQVDGATIGRARLAWPAGADESQPPEWLVFGATVRMGAMTEAELSLQPFATALVDEGFDDASSEHLVESFARHLMAGIAVGRRHGFRAVAKAYQARLSPAEAARFDIDRNGDLVARQEGTGEPKRRSLLDALACPSPAHSLFQTAPQGDCPNSDPAPGLEHRS